MHSNKYIFIYATVMTVIAAVLLALSAEGLKPMQEANIAFEKRTNILASVKKKGLEKKAANELYEKQVQPLVINSKGEEISGVDAFTIVLKDEAEKNESERQLPLYIFTETDGAKYYVVPVQGVGLWGPIWGYVSLTSDFNTIYGAFFDHKGETPGLGAEIATDVFQEQFPGKKILDENNQFTSVRVFKKGTSGSVEKEHYVDGISGGTFTRQGTDKIIFNLFQIYLPYFEKIKSSSTQQTTAL